MNLSDFMRKIVADAEGITVEEVIRREKELEEYRKSDEYKRKVEEERKQAEEEARRRYLEELTKDYPTNEVIKPTKANLNKIVFWSTSRYNDYRKSEVVEDLFKAIQKGEDGIRRFSCGTYTEATGGRGVGDYKLVIYSGVAKLIVNEGWSNQKIYEFTKYTPRKRKVKVDELKIGSIIRTDESVSDITTYHGTFRIIEVTEDSFKCLRINSRTLRDIPTRNEHSIKVFSKEQAPLFKVIKY